MSERGVFAVDRGVWDHPMFAPEPFTEREAWLWLVSAAAWAAKRIRIGRAMVDLQRGQLAFATRFLAEKWEWSHSKVVRFLKRLEIDTMVSTLATRDATLITICNYDKYAFGRNAGETQTETQPDTLPERSRNKEEELKKDNNKEIKEEQRASALVDDGWPNDFRQQFWAQYPNKVGRPKALAKLEGCRKRSVPWLDIWEGLLRYIREKPPDRSWMNPETFLNGERWNDQPAKVENGKRTGNPRTTGHDAILAVAARKARQLDRNDDLAGTTGAAGFAFGDGINRSGPRGNSNQAGSGERDHHRSEPDDQRIREGEIIPPDKNASGVSGRREFV